MFSMVYCGISGLFGGRRVPLLFAANILIVPVFAEDRVFLPAVVGFRAVVFAFAFDPFGLAIIILSLRRVSGEVNRTGNNVS
jgi:hypothetical protein